MEDRNHDETIEMMLRTNSKKPEFGIKSPSAFINLYICDVIKMNIPDYLHFALAGAGPQMANENLKHLSKDEIEHLDSIMAKICAPRQITRACRPLSWRNDWKAREWENFILYYSVPIFSLILNKERFEHWLLFVKSTHLAVFHTFQVFSCYFPFKIFDRFRNFRFELDTLTFIGSKKIFKNGFQSMKFHAESDRIVRKIHKIYG